MASPVISIAVATITVRELFGLYSYRLPQEGSLGPAAILYGDNGSGKTTILRLLFNLLSSADNKGHRTVLSQVPFRFLEVALTNGVRLTAERTADSLVGKYLLRIYEKDSISAEWDYVPRPERRPSETDVEVVIMEEGKPPILRRRQRSPEDRIRGEAHYLKRLKEVAPTSFILSAERHLSSDALADPNDEVELRRYMRYEEPKKVEDLYIRGRQIALSQASSAAARWLGRQAIQGTNIGSTNVHSVYVDIVNRLVRTNRPSEHGTDGNFDPTALIARLETIAHRTKAYSVYELASPLDVAQFINALTTRSPSRLRLIVDVLEPYLSALEARLDALKPIFDITERFTGSINSFLVDKRLTFGLTQGLKIFNRIDQELQPGQLSSGEQQLFLLFCHVLVSSEIQSLFIIDEPEISLNIKWQRRLVQSLLEVTQGTSTQFILASHSIELLAQHSEKVVKLTPT
jgi:ABC-type cobalamin/Fe3+-siderophores transport system ATPase subunit